MRGAYHSWRRRSEPSDSYGSDRSYLLAVTYSALAASSTTTSTTAPVKEEDF